MTQGDPERLLAEALRAQAARTPVPVDEPTLVTPRQTGYGLLSGNDLGFTIREHEAPEAHDPPTAAVRRALPTAWVLLLALLLGLAAGAVIGLLTLL